MDLTFSITNHLIYYWSCDEYNVNTICFAFPFSSVKSNKKRKEKENEHWFNFIEYFIESYKSTYQII